ncbi:MAG TPA: S8 family peptidase [Longimicrobium sp.]|nr:S8 family peptidase [Longimicrobium sp.]
MKRVLSSIALLTLAACADVVQPPAPSAADAAATRPDGTADYIVVLREEGDEAPLAERTARIEKVAQGVRARPERVFTSVLQGFSARMTPAQAGALSHRPEVAYVERDAEVRLFTTQANPISWGIDRIDDNNLPLDQSYTYTSTGAGVTAYILDTGIKLTHLDYVGRAGYIPNASNGDFVGDGHGSAADCQGHGSHVAGTVGGTYSGVAKGVTLLAGRVVNCSGGGNASMVIAGMDWVRLNGLKPGVVNMSLGYGNVQSVRDAATNLVNAGFTVVVAAGNGNFVGNPINACTEAPAGAPAVITVGATTSTDAESSFSNYGTCVDILAPGSAIYSSDYLVDNQVVTKSGTSMASPHVAGVAAQYLALNPTATPAQVWSAIQGISVSGTISLHRSSRKGGTPNRFLFTNY